MVTDVLLTLLWRQPLFMSGKKTIAEFPFWSMTAEDLLQQLDTSAEGLSPAQVVARSPKEKGSTTPPLIKDLLLFGAQFKSPLSLLLIFALIVSAALGEFTNAVITFAILFISGLLGFIQERKAGRATEQLKTLLQTRSQVRRNNVISVIPLANVVKGDIVILKAGDIIPADGLILQSQDLYVNESVLTGESFPAEKKQGQCSADTPILERQNAVFKGTSVISGIAEIIAVETGDASELGKIETEIGELERENAFEKGISRFGYMLMRVALTMAFIILIINIFLGRPAIDSLLFALALSVGLAPEMLPTIVTITLSAGAKRLAEKKVIVKKLASIQNLGAIDVLCSDKTGTLTEGEVVVHSFLPVDGTSDELIKTYAYLNAAFESGYPNPMDDAIRKLSVDAHEYVKTDEVPYDFIRKRLSIVVAIGEKHIMITKGALKNVLEVCSRIHNGNSAPLKTSDHIEEIQKQFEACSANGFRTVGVAYKDVTGDPLINKDDECEMIFLGFILLFDPPKTGILDVINDLRKKQVALKIITGDNALIAENIGKQIGLTGQRILSGRELHGMSDDALVGRVDDIDIFSETEPAQKERIIRALQKKGHVVGYIGDGINDASALKMADVGISVSNAVDVAKESADLILLEKTLNVLDAGITEGRKTYLNTLKYILITISANFGNMFSMAGASVFLPYLPLLPAQILLTNITSDIPALSIATDNVDDELLAKPRKWDLKLIRRFMIVFGLESSIFDFITFGTLFYFFQAKMELFQTGWFVESVITEILILLIIRTRRTFYKSRPGKALFYSSIAMVALIILTPYLPFTQTLGFIPLPLPVLLSMLAIAAVYGWVGEITKKILFRKMNF